MRKALFAALFSLVLFAVPTFAQHHGGGSRGNNGGHESHNGGHVQAQPQPRGGNQQHQQQHQAPAPYRGNVYRGNEGYRGGYRSSAEARTHWDGRRFDHGYYAAHWGPSHPFYWGRAGWWGPRWAIGSRFWFGGVWFSIIDPVPAYWYNDEVTVIYDEDCGCYYAVDPVYPGVRIHINVAF